MSGFFLLIAVACALAAAGIDQHLQGFRAPGASPAAFWLVPLRLKSDLYVPEKRHLVTRAWLCLGAMVLCVVLALATS